MGVGRGVRPLTLALLALLASPALAAGAGDLLRPTGQGLAAAGPLWVGPRPVAPPRRVVVLAPSVTDAIVAMGLTDRIVGVTAHDDAPEVAGLPRIGGWVDPSPEAILGLSPDLVLWVTDGGAVTAVRRLAELSVTSRRPFPIVALQVDGLPDVLALPRAVGEALGEAARGERLSRELSAGVDAIRARAARATRRRVLFVVGHEPVVVAGPRSFPDQLLRLCGDVNVVEGDRAWPVYPIELAVAANPDVVVDAAPREPAEGIQRLASVPAVRRGAVVRMRNDDLIRPGPRMIRGLAELFTLLHPEAAR
jgi:iron complex transport system substrate-binding protein